MPNKSFDYVRQHRYRCCLNLSTEPNILLPEGILAYRLINLSGKLASFLPAIQIFKTADFHKTGLSRLFDPIRSISSIDPVLHKIDKTDLINQIDRFGHSSALSLTDPHRTTTPSSYHAWKR